MNSNDKYIVFDWDGTLHDTKKLYAESVRKAYAFLENIANGTEPSDIYNGVDRAERTCKGFLVKSVDELSEDNLSKYLGMTAAQMWADFMPGLEENVRSQAEKIVGDSMVELVYNKSAALYDGVIELLDMLKATGHKLLILSNCKVAYLDAHRKVFELDKWFTDYYPAQKYNFISKEEILKQAMEEYPGEFTMVGDRFLDIQAGMLCGVTTIGCLYGFGSVQELSEADYLVASVRELEKILLN